MFSAHVRRCKLGLGSIMEGWQQFHFVVAADLFSSNLTRQLTQWLNTFFP
jgi:hypothetical protein